MARRAGLVRDGAALLRRNSADWMSAMIGRLSAGVGRRHPVAIRQALLIACSSVGMLKVNKTGEAGTPQGGRPEVILDNMTSSNRVHLAWLYIYSPVVIYFARKSIFHLWVISHVTMRAPLHKCEDCGTRQEHSTLRSLTQKFLENTRWRFVQSTEAQMDLLE